MAIFWPTLMSGKCTVSSPFSSEFDKMFRLGLTEGEVRDLNECIRDWIQDFPFYAQWNAEDEGTCTDFNSL